MKSNAVSTGTGCARRARRGRAPALAALAVLAVSGLGACGSGSDRPTVTATTRPDSATTAPGETTAPADTAPPATEPPTTGPPATTSPDRVTLPDRTTAPPATTAPPTTTPPTTTPATVPDRTTRPDRTTSPPPPTTAPAATTPPTAETQPLVTEPPSTVATTVPGSAETDTSGEGPAWWPLILAGLAAIGLVALLLSRRAQNAKVRVAFMRSFLDDATSISVHLAAASSGGATLVAPDSSASLAALVAGAQGIVADEPDAHRKELIRSVADQAQVLHGTVDRIALTTTAPDQAMLAELHDGATVLHAVTARAEAELFPPPPTPRS
jgi:hypothetical protein